MKSSSAAMWVRRSVAVMVAVALVAGCTAEGDRRADAGDPAGVGGGWSAERLPALVGTSATGPAVPLLEGVELNGSLGLATTTVPVLVMAEPPSGATRFDWSVTDVSGTESVFTTSTPEPRVRVADGAFIDGRTYSWSVVASAATGQLGSAGPFVVNVDTQREGRQAALAAGAVTVAAVSGEPVWSWQGPSLGAATGTVSWGLSYRPTGGTTDVLPASWRLQVAGPTWDRLEVLAGGVVGLRNRIGTTVTFREQSPGSYEALWGPGQSWPSGQFSTLVRNPDGSWVVTDLNRVVTTFGATDDADTVSFPTAVWTADSAQVSLEYSGDRLAALVDQVSGRRVTFAYGGGDCPAGGGDGFVDAPDGLLCGVTGWDGVVMALRYVRAGDGVQLGRLVAYSGTGETAEVTDLAYDASGRMVAMRSPLAGAAVASGAVDGLGDQDPRALTEIGYDETGRVASVTSPAPLVTRGVPGDAAQNQRPRWSVVYESPGVTSLVRDGVATTTGYVKRVVADPATMLTSTSTSALGATESTTWDVPSSAPLSFTAGSGLVSRTTYDASGLPVERRGPIDLALLDSPAAPRATTTYDESFASNPDGEPLTGLAATYWSNQQFSGTPAGADTGPSFDGNVPTALNFNWPSSPTGGAGWSARLTGRVAIPADGTYRFTVAGSSRLWVNGRRCEPTCDQELRTGEAPIRVDVTTDTDVAGVNVEWATPDAPLAPLPTSVLRPAYNLTASQTITDALSVTQPVEITSNATYDDPITQRITSMVSSSGLSGSRTYEPFNPEGNDWARPTGYADPSGAVSAVEYWNDDEQASPSCDGAERANQGGLPRLVTHPGGALPRTMTYDAAGRVVAWSVADGPTVCTTYDVTGRPLSTTYPSVDGAPGVEVTYDYAAGNNPLVSTMTSTVGDATTTTRVAVDLWGRPVQSTDPWGSETLTTYDPVTGGTASQVTRTQAGQTASSTFAYTPDGLLVSSAADGATVATYGYDPSGRMTAATLGDGTVGAMTYDALGNIDSLTWTSPDGSVRGTQEVFASSGRLLSRILTAPDGTATYNFGYDPNGRLTSTSLDTALPVSARQWGYEFDGTAGASANRTAQVVDGVRTTYTYDDQHRLVGTDDPTLAGEVTYDSRGNTTRLGQLTMTYSATGQLATATDGTTTIENLTNGVATTGRKVTTATESSEVRFTASGLQLDVDGRVLGRTLNLAPGVTVTTTQNAPTTWALPDLRGNATWILGGGGAGATTLYDAFGQELTPAPQAAVPTPAVSPGPSAAPAQQEAPAPVQTGDAAAVTTTTQSPDAPPDTTAGIDTTAATDTTGTTASTDTTASTAPPELTGSPSSPSTTALSSNATTSGPDVRPVYGWHGASGVSTLMLSVPLMEMGVRTYVPTLGRFLESDPVVNGGANPYAYVNGDPINGHDTTGTTDKWWAPLIGAVVAIAVGAIIGVATAGAGLGVVATVFVGVGAAAVGGALGEVTTELINTGTVDFKAVGYAALIDAALALVTFGAGKFLRGRQIARAERAAVNERVNSRWAALLDEFEMNGIDPTKVQGTYRYSTGNVRLEFLDPAENAKYLRMIDEQNRVSSSVRSSFASFNEGY